MVGYGFGRPQNYGRSTLDAAPRCDDQELNELDDQGLDELIASTENREDSFLDISNAAEQGHLRILQDIEAERKKIQILALEISDAFWFELDEHSKDKDIKAKKIGLRVRNRNGSLEASYFHGAHKIKKGQYKGVLKAQYLKRSGAHSYLARDYSFLNSWERDLIRRVEPRLARLRKASSELSKARVAINQSLKAIRDERSIL